MVVSALCTYENVVADKKNPRKYDITRITPHHMSGVHSGKWCADYFCETKRECSANYCIGVDGDIACNVPEEYRAWTSANAENDHRAITMELSDGDSSYNYMTDATITAFVNLCVDLFKRYPSLGGKMVYTGDETGNVTLHRWYQDTDCPSNWLINKLPEICYRVNQKLGADMSCFIVVKNAQYYFDSVHMKVVPIGTETELWCLNSVSGANGTKIPTVSWTKKQLTAFQEFLARCA